MLRNDVVSTSTRQPPNSQRRSGGALPSRERSVLCVLRSGLSLLQVDPCLVTALSLTFPSPRP